MPVSSNILDLPVRIPSASAEMKQSFYGTPSRMAQLGFADGGKSTPPLANWGELYKAALSYTIPSHFYMGNCQLPAQQLASMEQVFSIIFQASDKMAGACEPLTNNQWLRKRYMEPTSQSSWLARYLVESLKNVNDVSVAWRISDELAGMGTHAISIILETLQQGRIPDEVADPLLSALRNMDSGIVLPHMEAVKVIIHKYSKAKDDTVRIRAIALTEMLPENVADQILQSTLNAEVDPEIRAEITERIRSRVQ